MKTPNTLLVLLSVSIPSFMTNLDANIVAVSLNAISKSLHADFAAIEWVVSAYTLTFAAMLMPAGTLSDRYGRKRMLITGLAIFTVASALCGAATSETVLNWSRALQGVGAALQLSAALATLSSAFEGAERAKAFSFWGSVIGIAIMLGPVIGGLITGYLGWRWAFFVNVPVGGLSLLLTWLAVRESKDPQAKRLDGLGVVTFAGSLTLLTLALIGGNRVGWSHPAILAEVFAAAALFAGFIAVERRQARPMVDLRVFRRATYVGANIGGLTYAIAFLTMLTYLPLYFQNGLGRSPLEAGLLMLPIALPLFAVPRIVARWLSPRWSGRALLTVGLLLVGAGLLGAATQVHAFSYLRLVGPMLIATCGAGVLNGETARTGMTVIPADRAGMASGVSGTVKFSGLVLGFASLGAILKVAVSAAVATQEPGWPVATRDAITRAVVDGRLTTAVSMAGRLGGTSVVWASYAAGYEILMVTAGGVALVAAAWCWRLIDAAETAPIRGPAAAIPEVDAYGP